MNRSVPAPDDYEGVRYYDDAIREWRASARPIGAIWWTNVDVGCGHVHLTEEELDQRASAHIEEAIRLGYVR
jgi:nitric oxide synthase oxygenase domain/subunit